MYTALRHTLPLGEESGSLGQVDRRVVLKAFSRYVNLGWRVVPAPVEPPLRANRTSVPKSGQECNRAHN